MHRRALFKLALAAGAVGASGWAGAKTTPALLKPKALRAGMTVGLVAPASPAPERDEVHFGLDIIRSLGFNAQAGKHVFEKNQYLAGSDEQRAADINSFFADPSVDAIFCLRGGYGSARLLPLLDYRRIAQNPKVLLGYSDITALLNGLQRQTGLVTFHGPVAAHGLTDYSVAEFQKVLQPARFTEPLVIGAAPEFEPRPGRLDKANRLTVIRGGKASGRLVGGNLTVLTSLLGTPFEPEVKGAILFLEDIGEEPYRLDRMLTQWWLAGKLQQLNGIVFGKFTEAKASGNSFSIEDVLRSRCEALAIPVLRGTMIGHVADQTTVPLGVLAELDADAGRLTLLESAVS
ncbi:LD-carboxypeptidase [Simiduia curdlanivorans]|uniref:LD-carboxypeptidase n=1 Tax=Simiduia curdlanivorans TaxID=1492769 RepID=A0ABV8V1M3_9GAMM|nr:LD-carboxypeptidase [Simiduia curdlanivorans]MDN3638113.1 LD-carboxypeptidase [Simiduia curdlanivorans]